MLNSNRSMLYKNFFPSTIHTINFEMRKNLFAPQQRTIYTLKVLFYLSLLYVRERERETENSKTTKAKQNTHEKTLSLFFPHILFHPPPLLFHRAKLSILSLFSGWIGFRKQPQCCRDAGCQARTQSYLDTVTSGNALVLRQQDTSNGVGCIAL